MRTGIPENGGAEDPKVQTEDCRKKLKAAGIAHQSGRDQTGLEGQDQGSVVAKMGESIWTEIKTPTRGLPIKVDKMMTGETEA